MDSEGGLDDLLRSVLTDLPAFSNGDGKKCNIWRRTGCSDEFGGQCQTSPSLLHQPLALDSVGCAGFALTEAAFFCFQEMDAHP